MTELPKFSAITRLRDPVDMDGGMLRARRKAVIRSVVDGRTTLVRDNLSGRLDEVRTERVETPPRSNFVPVVSLPAIDKLGHSVNVDADRVATALAAHARRGPSGAADRRPRGYSPIPPTTPACWAPTRCRQATRRRT